VLLNPARRIAYPIFEGVPRMLVFATGVSARFERELGGRLRAELPGYRLPALAPMPGEEDVLRTFSREWLDYQWDGRSYWNMTPEHTYRCMDRMLDLEARPVRHARVLEAGIGIGGIADHVSRTQECELVGIDLSYAVDAARRHFGANPFLHVVQASVFAPPFAEESFDFVYSQEDEERSVVRKGLMLLERLLRPVCWRLPGPLQTAVLLPIVPLYLVHQNLGSNGQAGSIRYGFNEAMHAARDRFTPRYVHRHSNDEVGSWFRDAGYRDIGFVTRRQLPEDFPPSFLHCTGVDGVRS
jgi:hypothetical protein